MEPMVLLTAAGPDETGPSGLPDLEQELSRFVRFMCKHLNSISARIHMHLQVFLPCFSF
jgi:hypothetical protein